MLLGDNQIGISTLRSCFLVLFGAAVGQTRALLAELFEAFHARLTLSAAVDHVPNADEIANFEFADLIADFLHHTDNLMPGNLTEANG